MTLKRWGQGILATTASIAAGLGLVSCGASNTVDYLYSTSAKNNPGQVNAYRVDSQSGALTVIPGSPYPAGRNPVSVVADTNTQSLFVANHDDNTIERFSIGTDGKLYAQQNVNPSGTEPLAVAELSFPSEQDPSERNSSSVVSFLLVLETYQPGFTDLAPGPGALYVYKIDSSNGSIGSPVPQTVNGAASDFLPVGNLYQANPDSDTVAPLGAVQGVIQASNNTNNFFVYASSTVSTNITSCTGSSSNSPAGLISGFTMGKDGSGNPNGVLTPVTGSPFCSGVTPSSLASHPFGTFLYSTDSTQNQITPYLINNSGVLTAISSGPVATGTTPAGVTIDPTGQYLYVANRVGGNVSGYSIDQSTGKLSTLATGGTGVTDARPTAVIIEPALGRFVYTSNLVGGSLSGFTLNIGNGALAGTQNAPYPASGLNTSVTAVVHGNHPIIHVQNTAGGGSN